MAKHISFIEGDPKPKTKTWHVMSKYDENLQLGWIAWFSHWRKYAFYPKPDTIYEEDCLRDIAEFIEEKTREHKGSQVRSIH